MMREWRGLHPPARSVLAAAAALLAAWALGRLGWVAFAAVPLAEWIMARTPADLAGLLMDGLGPVARPSALLGAIAMYLGVAAAVGLCAQVVPALARGRVGVWLCAGGLGAALLAGLVFVARLPLLPNLVLALLFAGALAGLSWPAPGGTTAGRRQFLSGLAISSAGVLVTANVAFLDALRRAGSPGRGGVWLFRWERPAPRADGFAVAGLSPEVTTVERFYRMSKNVVDPDPDAGGWRLRAGDHRWSLDELVALPRADVICTLRCISNRVDGELMSTATFTGVRVRDLLDASGIAPSGDAVVFSGLDGHAEAIPVTAALDDDTIVAYAMNGRTLTRAHGHPARLVVPGRYGFKDVKWLSEVHISPGGFTGHWEEIGWTGTAEVKTMARIDVALRTAGGTLVAGVAFAGLRGVSAVRVRLDDGPWLDARLHLPPLGRSTWVQWRLDAPVAAENAVAQAFDGAGTPQPTEERGQFPDGAQGLHRVQVHT